MKNEHLTQALGKCITHCNYCATACLNQNDVQEMVDCMRANHLCAEVCGSLKQLLPTGYGELTELVKYCIQVCEACAVECEKHDLEACQKCATACRECVKACRLFLK